VGCFLFLAPEFRDYESTLNNLNNMKKLSVIALVAVGLLAASCNKKNRLKMQQLLLSRK
jgi:hypothetical protein